MKHFFQKAFLYSTPPVKRVLHASAHFIMPPRCLACDKLVANRDALCSSCFRDMMFIERPYCEQTGDPFSYDIGETLSCAQALAHPPRYRRLRSVARYENTARKLALDLKFKDRLDLAEPMGRWMVRAGQELLEEADILIPVPLHHLRLFERRFNQAAELTKVIAKHTGTPLALDGLKRIKATRQQVQLDYHQRHSNVSGAFRVPSERAAAIYGKKVVLIDDVVTTGATVNACTRALLREKARYVDVITFAKVVEDDALAI